MNVGFCSDLCACNWIHNEQKVSLNICSVAGNSYV